jgi:hypothetical protein
MKSNLKRFLCFLIVIIISTFIPNNIESNKGVYKYSNNIDTNTTMTDTIVIDSISIDTINLQKEIITEVQKYINSYGGENSKITTELFVKICKKYNIDIAFVLAQAQIESHFGTRGVAARTNSIFNVGTYDNGLILYTYEHPDESIEPYAILITENYLVNGKTIKDLMRDNGYVNYKGKRYASYRLYEKKLRKVYNIILESTSIDSLQKVYYNSDLLALK